MDHEIMELRKKKFTLEQIAKQLGITVGQVKYRLYKKSNCELESQQSLEQAKQPSNDLSLPLFYGRDEINLMVQSPTTLYTYWELTWPRMNLVSDFYNKPFELLSRVLRIYDVTDIWFDGRNSHGYKDIFISSEAQQWFIHDMSPGRTYIIDLGILCEGRFIPLLRSKPKATPPNREAGEYSELVPLLTVHSKERVSPKWFENFSTYSIY